MSLIITRFIPGTGGGDGHRIHICVESAQSIERFKELVQRAANLWPDAHPEIKKFADEITNDGVVMQDYSKQEYYKI